MSLRTLVVKELRELIREPHIIIAIVVLPALMYAAMGFVMKASIEAVVEQVRQTTLNLAVVDEDGGVYAERFIQLLTLAAGLNISITSPDEADAVIVIPAGFSDNMSSLRPAVVVVRTRVSDVSVAGMVAPTAVNEAVERVGRILASMAIGERGAMVPPEFMESPVRVEAYIVFRGVELTSAEASMLASSLFMLVFGPLIVVGYAATVSAASMGGEREEKTLEVLLSLPIPRSHIVVAKLVASTVLALLGSASVTAGLVFYVHSMVPPGAETATGPVTALAKVFAMVDAASVAALLVTLTATILFAAVAGMASGMLAQTVRGAQSVAGMVFFIVFMTAFPLMFVQLPGDDALASMLALVPFAQPVLAVKAALAGRTAVALAAVAASIVYTAASILVLARMLSSEAVITGFTLKRGRRAAPQQAS